MVAEDDDPSVVKMVFGVHAFDDVFRRVSFHPRLVGPAEQILGERAHLFQSRLNVKPAFRATGWPWHLDFNQWYRFDGMQTPRAVVAGLFLDDVNACNGPLMVIPGSQKRGHLLNEVSMEIGEDVVAEAARESGIVPLMGPPGTVVLFDCLIIHGSAPNITPWSRRIFYLNFSAASNAELLPLREPFHCDANVRPVAALADDCLLEWKATA
jgi:ectoine hydroxylase